MKKILGYAAIGMLAATLASPARADWTWNIQSTFNSYYAYGPTTFDPLGVDAPVQDYGLWTATDPSPADAGTLSGWITFDNLGTPTAWNFTTTASALGLPAYTDSPLAYSGFGGATYDSSLGSYSSTDWNNIGGGDVYFVDSDSFATLLDLILPPQLFSGIYTAGDQVFQSALEGPIAEGSFGCNTNPYLDMDLNDNYPGCYQEGNFRIETAFEGQNVSLNTVYTFVSGPNNEINRPVA